MNTLLYARPIWMVSVVAMFFVACQTEQIHADDSIRAAEFHVDVTPPIGSVLAYDPVKGVQAPLSCRGLVIDGIGKPVVLLSVDWIGIGNEGYHYFQQTIADKVQTDSDRVSIHTIHQHDAVWCDLSMDKLLRECRVPYNPFDTPFAIQAAERIASAAADAKNRLLKVTHVGVGVGRVEKVASNRRVLGPDGKVLHVRWSATKDPAVREYPEGLIDPELTMVSLWNESKPIVLLSYYATHPQSYYRTGLANPDFPGLARDRFIEKTGIPLIHFNGAGGNITAGKYNDGAVENRAVLTQRVLAGMESAWEKKLLQPIRAKDCDWMSFARQLPLSPHLDRSTLEEKIRDRELPAMKRFVCAAKLAWLQTVEKWRGVQLSCLKLGEIQLLHMPGELFIEYQLFAKEIGKGRTVCMAAYGEYGPEYIGTDIAYEQGGYETGPDASLVGPGVEKVIKDGIAELLGK